MTGLTTRNSIDVLDLPTRVRNALTRAGITTLGHLATRSDTELLLLRGFGQTSLAQVRERLAAWEREHEPVKVLTEKEPNDGDEYGHDATPLLPGRQVLHATWLPPLQGEGCIFLWGEGEPLPPRRGRAPKTPIHPFHVPPAALRDLLPGLIPQATEEARVLAHLPATGSGPQPSPQLIRDFLAEEPGAPETLAIWQVDGLVLPPLAALPFLNDLPRPEALAPRVALGADLHFWSLAGKFILELLAQQQFVPTLTHQDGTFRAVWIPVLDRPDDLQRVEQLAQAMPSVCRALAIPSAHSPLEREEGEEPP
ncbi:MAG: DNA-directed RNA polymerase subunit alpha C-terminal domain-containing protein, partial [Chloroflexota bacterium]|nr:DNA-directed RNA polymerase subunit alpha C-terminal domain-containing protein [Chloroflexota bacterium]